MGWTSHSLKELEGRCALVLLGILLGLLSAETLIRITGLAPEVVAISRGRFRLSRNPGIGYVPAPAVHLDGDPGDFYDYAGASNSLGYRDYEHTVDNPRDHYRIVVLGDSIGAGLLIEDRDEIFPAILESLLRQKNVRAEVINLSVSGYNTQQEVETLKDWGLRYGPDLVLLAYCLNDRGLDGGGIMEALLDLELRSEGIPASRVIRPLLIHSALYRLLRFSALPSRRTPEAVYRASFLAPISSDTTEAYFRELGRLGEEHGFEVLVTVFPDLRNLNDYPFPYEHRRVSRLSRESGLHFFDLLDTFRECQAGTKEPVAYDRFHPTERGHRCAAESLADMILLRVLHRLP